ncbi:MAG: hypothetical protein H7061_09520 [Bdellovibrionaceae bacterium]|nr:hypothetical protein [Bdellovibrio sp.]
MSQDSDFLKNTLDLIESDPEVKSFIYQQILDFNPFVTPETLVMVIARDPNGVYNGSDDAYVATEKSDYQFRIAVILKNADTSIEAEAYDDNIFGAIRLAKETLLARLIEIQNEIENPKERILAIQQASDNKPVH